MNSGVRYAYIYVSVSKCFVVHDTIPIQHSFYIKSCSVGSSVYSVNTVLYVLVIIN